MPTIPAGAKTTDMSAQAAMMRVSPWGRIKAAVRYAIAGIAPDTWMSPSQPVEPVAQQAFGRNRDYPVGYNLRYTPRAEELSSFAQLRLLADSCDLVRLAIETRKDQMAALQWSVAHVDPDKNVADDPRAKRIMDLFKRPDGALDWDTWLRMLLEDVLVIDAPAILPRKLNSGALYGFEVIDGASIKPLVDDRGRRPLPPSPAYQQIIKGLPAVDYTSEELIYRPRNPRSHKFYGYSPVEQILLTVNVAIRRGVSQLQYYTEGNIPGMFASVPKEWTPQQIEQFQQYWDSVIEGDQAYKRKARFVPGDTKVTNMREPPLKDEFDEWLARVVCYAFSLPPTAFVKQMNRSTSETQQETSSKEGLGPLMGWVKRLMDHLIQTYLGAPDLEFRWVEEESIDPQVQAEVLTTYQKTGVYSINEIRAKLGEDPIPDEGGDAHLIITGSGATPLEQAMEPPQPPPQLGKPGDSPNNGDAGGDPPDEPPPGKKKVTKAAGDPDPQHVHDAADLTAAEQKLQETIAAGLKLAQESVVQQVKDATGAVPEGAAVADVSGLIDQLSVEALAEVRPELVQALEAAAKDGAQHGLVQLNIGGEDMLNLVNDRAVEFAQQRAAELIATDGTGGELVEATRNLIRATVQQAVEEGWSSRQLANALEDSYAFSAQRAATIARTELAFADSRGNLASYIASGVVKRKRWVLDPDPCPVCVGNADAGEIDLQQEFPGGVMAPPQHPNCRCAFVPITED